MFDMWRISETLNPKTFSSLGRSTFYFRLLPPASVIGGGLVLLPPTFRRLPPRGRDDRSFDPRRQGRFWNAPHNRK
eukprot:7096741-Pyramimonas_sp.AAC.1